MTPSPDIVCSDRPPSVKARPARAVSCPPAGVSRFSARTSQTVTACPVEVQLSRRLSGVKTSDGIQPVLRPTGSSCRPRRLPDSTSHSCTASGALRPTSILPSGEKKQDWVPRRAANWPTSLPVVTSHSASRPPEQVTARLPSRDRATLLAYWYSASSSFLISLPLLVSHSWTVRVGRWSSSRFSPRPWYWPQVASTLPSPDSVARTL